MEHQGKEEDAEEGKEQEREVEEETSGTSRKREEDAEEGKEQAEREVGKEASGTSREGIRKARNWAMGTRGRQRGKEKGRAGKRKEGVSGSITPT